MKYVVKRPTGETMTVTVESLAIRLENGAVKNDWPARAEDKNEWNTVAEVLAMPVPEMTPSASPVETQAGSVGSSSGHGRRFCRNCGKEVHEKAIACPACGVPPMCERKFCQNCGASTQPSQVLCIKCGGNLATGGIQSVLANISGPAVRTDARILQVAGGIGIVIGLAIILWARSHSPDMSFTNMMADPNNYVLKRDVYNIFMIVAVVFGLAGIVSIVKSFIPKQG